MKLQFDCQTALSVGDTTITGKVPSIQSSLATLLDKCWTKKGNQGVDHMKDGDQAAVDRHVAIFKRIYYYLGEVMSCVGARGGELSTDPCPHSNS